jgi:hypothetical protein
VRVIVRAIPFCFAFDVFFTCNPFEKKNERISVVEFETVETVCYAIAIGYMYRWRRICDQRNWVNYSIVYRFIEMDVFVCVSKRIDHIFGVESCKHKAIRSRISVKRFSFYFPQVKLKGSLFVQRPARRLNCWIFCCVNIPVVFRSFWHTFRK